MRRPSVRPLLGTSLTAVALALLSACEADTIRGRVVEGQATILTSIAADDARKNDHPVEGAEVEIRTAAEGGGPTTLGRSTAGADGSFSISVGDPKKKRGRLEVYAHREGYLPLRSELYAPGEDQTLLIVLKNLGLKAPAPAKSADAESHRQAPESGKDQRQE